jgi:hypothetical protein
MPTRQNSHPKKEKAASEISCSCESKDEKKNPPEEAKGSQYRQANRSKAVAELLRCFRCKHGVAG